MAKLRPNEKRVQLSFIRPEDLRLHEFMTAEAYRCRWSLDTFILASLTEAFKDKMDEFEVAQLAAEAAQKVRERAEPKPPVPVPPPPSPQPVKAAPVSMEAAAKMANEEIAKLDALAAQTMGKRKPKGVPPLPPMPK